MELDTYMQTKSVANPVVNSYFANPCITVHCLYSSGKLFFYIIYLPSVTMSNTFFK